MQPESRGFSLFSLATAMAIAAVIAALAVPNFQRIARQWTLTRSANALLAALHQARSSATTRGLPVALCQTDAPGHCVAAAVASGSPSGWQVFTESVVHSPPRLSAGDELLGIQWLPDSLRLVATRTAVTYWPTARSGTTATFLFCDSRNLVAPRAVIVSQTGRPRLSARMADGSVPDCGNG